MKFLLIAATVLISYGSYGQVKRNDVNTPLHAMKPDYKIPYGIPEKESIKSVLKKVFNYLDAVTPAQFIDKTTNIVVSDLSKIDTNTVFQTADFRLTSYEWGVTYAACCLQGKQREIRLIRIIRRNVCILLRMRCLHLPGSMQNIHDHLIPSASRLRHMRWMTGRCLRGDDQDLAVIG
jgi:hypothetical protein